MSSELRLGLGAGLAAYVMWGMMPIYIKALGHLPPELVLVHRIIWSAPTGLVLLLVAGRLADLYVRDLRKLGWLAMSSMLIAVNWLVYIWAVGEDRVLEASLGYYINPLVNVAIGAAFLSERLNRLQWLAVGLAGIGVAIMAIALGRVPWVSLVLCFSFAFYSLIRKQVAIDGRAGFVVEAALLSGPALIWTWSFHTDGGAVWGTGGVDIALLLAAGPVTALPLICFAISARRLRLSTIGMMQYIGPTLQFALGLMFGESFGWTHAAAFAFIWLGLALFSVDSFWPMSRSRVAAE